MIQNLKKKKKKEYFKHLFKAIILFIILTFIIIYSYNLVNKSIQKDNDIKETKVCIKEICVNAELAINEKQRAQGLMYITHLNENEGMLFVFENEEIHSFWMKNTLISLDILWINQNLEIIDIKTMIPCIGECIIYTPKDNSTYVLEVNENFAINNKIMIGDKVIIDYLK
jgi:uncharacterized protein